MKAPFGVALLGGGIFIKTEHLPAVLACELLDLKAIYSRSLQSAEETAALIPSDRNLPRPSLYAEDASPERSLDQLLARADIHCVIIALPIVVQTDFVLRALRAGKHVLAEKPIARDVLTARALLSDAQASSPSSGGATLSIAENFRFLDKFTFAAAQARALGGPLEHFAVRVMFCIDAATDKYYKTEWRKTPTHQGGFLLDAGVHFAAAAWLLFEAGGPDGIPEHVHAFAGQVTPHLPPMDSVAAILRTRGGASGVWQFSVGTQSSAFDFDFAYAGGNVKISGDSVTVKKRGGEAVVTEFKRSSGVVAEVRAWAEGLEKGEVNALQTAREAFNDLELIEKIFQSGEAGGAALRYDFL